MSAACATCAGQCCTLGATRHAFLTIDTIQRFRHRHDRSTEGDVIDHYLGRLPVRSVEGSCVFHGEQGCVLPREERSDICNRYHCEPQLQLARRYDETGADRALIVAYDGSTSPAIGLYESDRGWRSFPIAAPIPTPIEEAHALVDPMSPAVAGVLAAAVEPPPPSSA